MLTKKDIEFQLSRYARKLLKRKQLRHLLLFAWRVGHPLRPWLLSERTKSATLESLDEWQAALAALHLHFCILLKIYILIRSLIPVDIPKPDRLPPIPASLIAAPSTPPASPRNGLVPPPSPMIIIPSIPPQSPLSIGIFHYIYLLWYMFLTLSSCKHPHPS